MTLGVSSMKVAASRRPATTRCAMHDCTSGPVSITIADRTVGLAVAEARGYRFVAVDPRFGLLDGSRFGRVTDAHRAADRLGRIVLAGRCAERRAVAPGRA